MSVLLVLMTVSAQASNETHFARYLTVQNVVDDSYGLNKKVTLVFPENIHTIGQAVVSVLGQSDYSLLPDTQTNTDINELYKKPLTENLRSMGDTTLKNGLLSLSGRAYQLVLDPEHKLLTYKIRNKI